MDKKQVFITQGRGNGKTLRLQEEVEQYLVGGGVGFNIDELYPFQQELLLQMEHKHWLEARGEEVHLVAEADMLKAVEELAEPGYLIPPGDYKGFKEGEFVVIDSFHAIGKSIRQQGMSELFQNMYDVEPGVPSTKAEYRKGLNTFLKGKRK